MSPNVRALCVCHLFGTATFSHRKLIRTLPGHTGAFEKHRWGNTAVATQSNFLGKYSLPKHQPSLGEEKNQTNPTPTEPHLQPAPRLVALCPLMLPTVLRTGASEPSPELTSTYESRLYARARANSSNNGNKGQHFPCS